MNFRLLLVGVSLAPALLVGCEARLPYGDFNSIIAVMSPERWQEVSEEVYGALETTIFTVRDEKAFTVTYQEPYGPYWSDLRRFRQMLLVGTASDRWVEEALDRAGARITEPGIHQLRDVWADGQTVTLVLLPEDAGPEELTQHLPEVARLFDEQYRAYARNRMFTSGVDTALADTLQREAGFLIYVPLVYRWEGRDSAYIFRNDNPDPSELIRQVGVTWVSPALTGLEVDDVLDWRASFVAAHYSEPQDMALDPMFVDTVDVGGLPALEIQAQWRNPPDRGWPAGGPFITRAVTCPAQNRTYLVDSWLYAPGAEKFEYMIQLETILDTFRCEG